MKKYMINKLDIDNFVILVSLLDYETKISDCLKSIRISSFNVKEILVDTALCSGMNKYRFIATAVNTDGSINLNNYRYVDVSSQIIEIANDILRKETHSINNSILTNSQKRQLRNSPNYLAIK